MKRIASSTYRVRAVSLLLVATVWLGGTAAEGARAAARVELVLAAGRDTPILAQQTWARELGQAGVRSVRLLVQRPGDRVGIATRGTKDAPIYVVTGTLDSRGDVTLPGGRYRSGDARRIAAWLDELARLGPPDSREPVAAFGLLKSHFAVVRQGLAGPIAFSTRGKSRAEVIRKIVGRIKLPVRLDERLLPAAEERIDDELQGLSCGTALACALGPAGMALIPRMSAAGPECVITTARGQREIWPIGWKPEKPRLEVLPKLFDHLTVNVENAALPKVLDAMQSRLQAPILLDRPALARGRIDLEKSRVTLPQKRTTYDLALDRALYQARLTFDLRVDEAGKPLLWVTTIKVANSSR